MVLSRLTPIGLNQGGRDERTSLAKKSTSKSRHSCRAYRILGPFGTWDGGREKASAAICRKVAMAKLAGKYEVEIWGDGEQTRSFCFIDDCVTGIHR